MFQVRYGELYGYVYSIRDHLRTDLENIYTIQSPIFMFVFIFSRFHDLFICSLSSFVFCSTKIAKFYLPLYHVFDGHIIQQIIVPFVIFLPSRFHVSGARICAVKDGHHMTGCYHLHGWFWSVMGPFYGIFYRICILFCYALCDCGCS